MAFKLLATLLLVPAIYARIQLDIVASNDESERQVLFSGSNVDLISDSEKNTFKLHDSNLKSAINAYYGRRPDDAYLRSPTPWGDLYLSYGWPQVTRTLTPQRARILQVDSQPTVVLTQIFHNNSTKPAQFKAQIKQEVQNTVSSTWQKGGDLTVGQNIEYSFDIKAVTVGGKTSFSYTSKWGESHTKSESVTVGSESGVTINLDPNQSVVAELYATKGTMKIQMDYEASLSGSVAVNYADTYRGHHFWSLDVNAVMSSGGLEKSAQSSEVISLGYYTDSRVVIRDSQSNMMLYSIPLKMF